LILMRILLQFHQVQNVNVEDKKELETQLQKLGSLNKVKTEVFFHIGSIEHLLQEYKLEEIDVLAFMGLSYRDCLLAPLESDLGKLKWIHVWTTGIDPVLTPKFCSFIKERYEKLVFTSTPNVRTETIAEHVIMLMTALSRKLPIYFKNQQQRVWQVIPTSAELFEKSVVVAGFGDIGKRVASLCNAFRMKVRVVTRDSNSKTPISLDQDTKGYTFYSGRDGLFEALRDADFVILCMSLNKENLRGFDHECFKQMKKSSFIVNIARGKLINEKDLLQALNEGMIAGAGLDVFEVEPLPKESELWNMENVIITPHSSFMQSSTFERTIAGFLENFKKFLNGEKLDAIVRKDQLVPIW